MNLFSFAPASYMTKSGPHMYRRDGMKCDVCYTDVSIWCYEKRMDVEIIPYNWDAVDGHGMYTMCNKAQLLHLLVKSGVDFLWSQNLHKSTTVRLRHSY